MPGAVLPTTASQSLNPPVIGQAESALGALLWPVPAETGTSFEQRGVLAFTARANAFLAARAVR